MILSCMEFLDTIPSTWLPTLGDLTSTFKAVCLEEPGHQLDWVKVTKISTDIDVTIRGRIQPLNNV